MTHSDEQSSVPPEARAPLPPKGVPTAPSAMGGMGSTGPIRVVDLAALEHHGSDSDHGPDHV